MEKKTIGIIGGMGPLATADLFHKLVTHTRAACDQEHLRVLIDSNTAIPDRTAALLHGGEDPCPQMIKSARLLEAGGADCLIMPCNTAHSFHAQVQGAVGIPLLSMTEMTCRALRAKGIHTAGLLATDGTVASGVYDRAAAALGITLLKPDPAGQAAVMALIYSGVKAGAATFDTAAVRRAVDALQRLGAQTMVLGCTELPLAMTLYQMDFPAIDPTLELAKGAILFAGGQLC